MRAYNFVREHREIKAAVLEYRWSGHAIYEGYICEDCDDREPYPTIASPY